MKAYIFKGFHHSTQLPKIHFGNCLSIVATVRFDRNCAASVGNDVDQQDWSKLFGISFGFDRHRDSARWGWRYNPSKGLYEFSYYGYRDKIRYYAEEPGFSCVLDDEVVLGITINNRNSQILEPSVSYFHPNGEITKPYHAAALNRCGYYQNFYHGGNKKAPQLMSAKISRKIILI